MRLLLPVVVLVAVVPLLLAGHGEPREDHWRRVGDAPARIILGDNVTGRWDAGMRHAAAAWSAADNIEVVVWAGHGCDGPREHGRVEVCGMVLPGDRYAQVFRGVDHTGHYVHGEVGINTAIDHPDGQWWADAAMCHEVGHMLGLAGHPAGTDPDSCMDRDVPSATPDEHDRAVVARLHDHVHERPAWWRR